MTAKDHFTRVQNAAEIPFTRRQWGGSIGGPLLRNRIFFFGAYENISEDNSIPVPDALFREKQLLVNAMNAGLIPQGLVNPNHPRFGALPARLTPLARPQRPARVDAGQPADVWFEPGLVLEVLSAELTLSPNHTAGWGQIKEDAGLAMRFPRFTGRWRDDKSPEDATTTQELVDLYRIARHLPTGTT